MAVKEYPSGGREAFIPTGVTSIKCQQAVVRRARRSLRDV
jgi:hypothetical protein